MTGDAKEKLEQDAKVLEDTAFQVLKASGVLDRDPSAKAAAADEISEAITSIEEVKSDLESVNAELRD